MTHSSCISIQCEERVKVTITPLSVVASSHLRSAVRHQLAVPSHRLSTLSQLPARRRGTYCQHTFVVWRTAPLHLDDYLRLICFLSTSVYSALGVSAIMRYINRRFTYLLTYLPPLNQPSMSSNCTSPSHLNTTTARRSVTSHPVLPVQSASRDATVTSLS